MESYTPPPPPAPYPPPPPPLAMDSGGEASMSSISDTDLGDISPPQPRRPLPDQESPRPPSPPPASSQTLPQPPVATSEVSDSEFRGGSAASGGPKLPRGSDD